MSYDQGGTVPVGDFHRGAAADFDNREDYFGP